MKTISSFFLLPREILLCPTVCPVTRVWWRPGAVPTEVDIWLGAVLHWTSVHGLVDETRKVGDAHVCRELVDSGGVTALARSSGAAVDHGLDGEREAGEGVTRGDVESVRQGRQCALGPATAAVNGDVLVDSPEVIDYIH